MEYFKTCSRCNGSGKFDRGTCFECNGRKAVPCSCKNPMPRFEVFALYMNDYNARLGTVRAKSADAAIKQVLKTKKNTTGFDLSTVQAKELKEVQPAW